MRALPKSLRKKVDKALILLEANPRHPSLHLEKIDAGKSIWSGRVDRGYRFTFQWVPNGILLRKLGAHDAAYRHP